MVNLENANIYKRALLTKLAMWDWSKTTWNTYTSFFDDAYTVLEDDRKTVIEFNEKMEDFRKKYGLTITQGEIKVYLRIIGVSSRRMIKDEGEAFETYGGKPLGRDLKEREINWLSMAEDLRMIKVWVQTKLKVEAEELGLMME